MSDADLSPPPGLFGEEEEIDEMRFDDVVDEPVKSVAKPSQEQKAFSGIGEIKYKRDPISCVVEILKRQKKDKHWHIVPPFTGGGGENAFSIMQATTTKEIYRGKMKVPAREPHPAFNAFNYADPGKCQMIRAKIVGIKQGDAFSHFLGAFMPPPGEQDNPAGWWCRGDGTNAQRWVDGKLCDIPCPGRQCKFQQEVFGRGPNKTSHCKPNMSLVAQFDWPDHNGQPSPLPKTLFMLSSKSWNTTCNALAMFDQINDVAKEFFPESGSFPIFGLPFTMNLQTTVKKKKGRVFPQVKFSISCDLFEHFRSIIQLKQHGGQIDQNPVKALPPDGYTQRDLDQANEITLNPKYLPSNERD